MKERLQEEIEHKRPGTFFRSIGAVLGFLPILGHLSGKKNPNNYKFSIEDTEAIKEWLYKNVNLYIKAEHNGIEHKLIRHYSPLLNWQHNRNKCYELKIVRDKCRKIARNNNL